MLAIDPTADVFDPVLLSVPENIFVAEHAGKAPSVIKRVPIPADVNINAVMPVLEHLYALEEVRKADKVEWVGVQAIKDRCKLYVQQVSEWGRLKAQQGAGWPSHPTMAGWDSRGKPTLGATGSDSGRVRTYFDEHGDRKRLALGLHESEKPTYLAPWVKQVASFDKLIENDTEGWIRCPVCQHTERYRNDAPSERNTAYSRMARHLLSEKNTQLEAHRELHTKAFGR